MDEKDNKDNAAQGDQPPVNTRIKPAASARRYTPKKRSKAPGKVLAERRVRHYTSETLGIIKNSLAIMNKAQANQYTSALTAIKTALFQLADTLTTLLAEDPQEQDAIQHRNLLTNFFQLPGSQSNGVHLVATTNIEALAEDLGLDKNAREYHWLMNNGVTILERKILASLDQQMLQLEQNQQEARHFQNERAIALQQLAGKA